MYHFLDCGVHWSCQTMHVKKCTFKQKKLLLVEFLPMALYETISVNFFHKIMLGQLYACTITWLRTLI